MSSSGNPISRGPGSALGHPHTRNPAKAAQTAGNPHGQAVVRAVYAPGCPRWNEGVNEFHERYPLNKFLKYGGIVASTILIVFGIGAIIVGANGRSTVRDNLAQEKIVGSADMTP